MPELPPVKATPKVAPAEVASETPELSLPELFRKTWQISPEHHAALRAPLPKEAIERTEGSKTGKGYNTTGYGYQWIADRFDEVFGPEHWREIRTIISAQPGPSFGVETVFESTIQVGTWDRISESSFFVIVASHSHYGGHVAKMASDAYKGGATNAFKKCAAFGYGVGSDAWRNAIDEDNQAQDPQETKRPEIDADEWTGEEKVWWGKFKGTPFSEVDSEQVIWWRDNMTKDPKIKTACSAELIRRRFSQEDDFAG